MKKLILILIASAALAVYSQVVVDQQTLAFTHDRWLSAVNVNFRYDNTLEMRGFVNLRTLSDTNVVQEVSLKVLTLSGTNLDQALSDSGLPTQTQVRGLFRKLFYAAWTNSLVQNNIVQ